MGKSRAQRRCTGTAIRQSAGHPLGRITLAGYHINEFLSYKMPLRIWDTYSAVLVIRGTARFYDVTGFESPVGPGDLMLMFPGHGYRYQVAQQSPWSEIWMQFQGPIFDLWRQTKMIDPSRPVIHLHPLASWLRRFEKIFEPLDLPSDRLILEQICRLQAFLAEAMSHSPAFSHRPGGDLWLIDARALLDRVPVDKAPNWKSLAASMGLSHERFRKRFTHQMGASPGKYLMARRIDHACALLEDRSVAIKEIADACGFCDVFHFSRRFKQGTGLSPNQYRRHKLHNA